TMLRRRLIASISFATKFHLFFVQRSKLSPQQWNRPEPAFSASATTSRRLYSSARPEPTSGSRRTEKSFLRRWRRFLQRVLRAFSAQPKDGGGSTTEH